MNDPKPCLGRDGTNVIDGRCGRCGCSYHCGSCGVPTNSYGMGTHMPSCPLGRRMATDRARQDAEQQFKQATCEHSSFACRSCHVSAPVERLRTGTVVVTFSVATECDAGMSNCPMEIYMDVDGYPFETNQKAKDWAARNLDPRVNPHFMFLTKARKT